MIAHITPPIVSDDDLIRISNDNPGWHIERADDGSLVMSPPTGTPGGAASMEAAGQLWLHAKRVGGKVFDSSTGFKTPGGGVVQPDAAWLSAEHVAQFAQSEETFWSIMPDVVIEVASRTDRWRDVTDKIDKYIVDGAGYALALDPQTRSVYECGTKPHDLELDHAAIFDA